MSWQRPEGPMRRDFSRTGLSLRLCAGVLAFVATMAAPAQPTYALLGQPAPDFALHASAGDNVRLSEHRGDVVVLSFWGSRCTPCRAQLAALDRSFLTYRSAGLPIYGIGVDDDPGAGAGICALDRCRLCHAARSGEGGEPQLPGRQSADDGADRSRWHRALRAARLQCRQRGSLPASSCARC